MKTKRGLNLRLKENNEAFMIKLVQGLLTQPEALQVQVLKTKYKYGPSSMPKIKRIKVIQTCGKVYMVFGIKCKQACIRMYTMGMTFIFVQMLGSQNAKPSIDIMAQSSHPWRKFSQQHLTLIIQATGMWRSYNNTFHKSLQ